MAKEIIKGIEVYSNRLSDNQDVDERSRRRYRLVEEHTLPILDRFGGGRLDPDYDIIMSDDPERTRSLGVDLMENRINVFREEDEKMIELAIELAKKYREVEVGDFFVVRPYKSI